jgi:glycosyltransferase involved in cell wall biosynthesis
MMLPLQHARLSGAACASTGSGAIVVDGKHLLGNGRPFHVKGVTYGTFRRRGDGALYPEAHRIALDFEQMAAAGVNTVRLYTLPPRDLLDAAEANGLSLMVGLDYHDWRMEPESDRSARRRIVEAGRLALDEALERCHGHSNVLALAVGNEVPVDLVRLHGVGHVEDTLSDLIARLHASGEGLLATYVNFPTTEFLQVEGQDVVCFNVFLERPDALERYLRHLQIVAGDRPLLVTELGLASQLHGLEEQGDSLAWQLDLVTETGCAGACVFSWTDEWAVDDRPVSGWDFGLTTTQRRPKPALARLSAWTASVRDLRREWRRLSVVVCAHNEEATIVECLESLAASDYPGLEVIVCVDGSTDATHERAARFPFKVLDLPHGGLSRARNVGLEEAKGEIVAYLDADAACHPDWPFFLVLSLGEEGVVATGGPNLPFSSAGTVEQAVARSPGDPVEVLVGDDRAEHVPGCNMAFRADALAGIGGFDVAYESAGDDVDVCWRLLDRGHEIGFAPAAQVRHHRRNTIRRYLQQQCGYGRAERMLAGAHPHRFNGLGQARWAGVVYAKARFLPSLLRPVIYHGYQGLAPFQPITGRPAENATGWLGARLPLLLPLALLGLLLRPFSPWFLLAPSASLLALVGFAVATALGLRHLGRKDAGRIRALAGMLHVAQPFARLWGRLTGDSLPSRERLSSWSGDRNHWLAELQRELRASRLHVEVGDPHEAWDLEVRNVGLVTARVATAVVWSWVPRWRLRQRIGGWGLVLLVAAGAAWTAGPSLGLTAMVAAIALIATDSVRLRARLERALERTTRAARVADDVGQDLSPLASPIRQLPSQPALDMALDPPDAEHRYLSPKRVAAGEER